MILYGFPSLYLNFFQPGLMLVTWDNRMVDCGGKAIAPKPSNRNTKLSTQKCEGSVISLKGPTTFGASTYEYTWRSIMDYSLYFVCAVSGSKVKVQTDL